MSGILKIEAFSGASGDMFLGALAGLTEAYDELKEFPELLGMEKSAEILISETNKNGIVCKQVKVIDKEEEKVNRHLTEIIEIIDNSELSETAKQITSDIFNIIGKAESEVHQIPMARIHFHEVGAIDSIIDVCGAAWLIDKLGISKSYCTPVTTGKGFVKTAHGLLPIPAPAAKLILEGIPTIYGEEEGERITPTGAAIIKYLNPEFEIPALIDKKSSYGSGEKEFKTPNVLRLSLCEELSNSGKKEVIVIETNIDDFNPEFLGVEFQNELLNKGALDVFLTQIIMKKGRPGILLTALCREKDFNSVSEFILSATSAIGLRYYKTNRLELERKTGKIIYDDHEFDVKISSSDNFTKIKPESSQILNYSSKMGVNPEKVAKAVKDLAKNKK